MMSISIIKPLKSKVRKELLTDDEIAAAMAVLHVEGEIPVAGGEEGGEDASADWESNSEVPDNGGVVSGTEGEGDSRSTESESEEAFNFTDSNLEHGE